MVPMEVGAMKGSGKKGDEGKKGYGKGKYGKSFGKYDKSNEYSKNNEHGKSCEKCKDKVEERQRTRKGRETSTQLELPRLLQVMWQVGAQGERVLARLRSRSGGSPEFFREFSGAQCSDHTCGCEDGNGFSRSQ